MSSSSSNGAESDLGDDVDKDKQTKPKPKPMPFRRCSTGSRCRIHSNRQSSLNWHQLAVAEQQDIQNIRGCNILYIQCVGRNCRGAIPGAEEGGSICPAKYTFLATLGAQQQQCSNVSTSAAATATLHQKPQCNRSHSIPIVPRDYCSNRFRDFPCPLAQVSKVPDRVSLLAATCPSAHLLVWQHLLQRILAAFSHQQAPN